MKHLYLLILVLASFQFVIAQGWNSTVTTTFNTSYGKLDNFANKDGIHVLVTNGSSVKYVLLSSSGSIVRQATLENVGGDFPNITGDGSTVMAVYLKGSTIKAQKSNDAGATWSDDAIPDITFSDSYCSGVDATKDNHGLHVCYATRAGTSGPWETYYQMWDFNVSQWVYYKNVTDYTGQEVGGFPTLTSSADRVHISYNTGSGSDPTGNSGDAKTRDYNYSSWDTPQLVYGQPAGASMVERIFSDGTYLHMFFYKLVNGMGDYHSDLYHTKRTIGGTSWSAPTGLSTYDDVSRRASITGTTNGKINITYLTNGVQYRNYDGTTWSSEQLLSSTGYTIYTHNISSVSNDLFACWTEAISGSTYLKYRQYDATPTSPQDVAVAGSSGQHPTISWAANPEPDVSGYKVYRKITPYDGAFSLIATVNYATTSYTDTYIYVNSGSGDPMAYYYVTAYDASNYTSAASSTVSIRVHPPGWPKIALNDGERPASYQLSEAYPNPFNPSSEIRFALPQDSRVRLVVYDALGREITNLAEGFFTAGTYTCTWNPEGASSGLYFARIQVTDDVGQLLYTKVNKLMLMK